MRLKVQLPVGVGGIWQRLPKEYVFETLRQLCELSGQLQISLGYGTVQPTLTVIEASKKEDLYFGESLVYKRADWFEVLEIEVDLDVGEPQLREIMTLNPDLSAKDALSLLVFGSSELFKEKLYDLMLIANLARPGSIELFAGNAYIENRLVHHTERFSSHYFRDARRLANQLDRPKLGDLAVLDFWQWSNQIEGMSSGFSNDATGRALNALTHLFAETSDPFQLFWALMGLEALNVRGPGSVMEQLRERIHTFLGEPSSYKKKFSSVYRLRSQLIHGQIDFSSAYSEGGAPKDDEFWEEVLEATNFATAILLATLQELVRRDWRELRFFYLVDGLQ